MGSASAVRAQGLNDHEDPGYRSDRVTDSTERSCRVTGIVGGIA